MTQKQYATREVLCKTDALEGKIKQLQPTFFGIPLIRFKIEWIKKVYVPYRYFVYDYEMRRKTLINRSGRLDRKGVVAIVFDCNEVHPFEFDPEDDGGLALTELAHVKDEGIFLPEKCSVEEAREAVESRIQNKILRRLYADSGELTPVKNQLFYRPAWELGILYKGHAEENIRYAYADGFGVENEHILGLKLRLDGSF